MASMVLFFLFLTTLQTTFSSSSFRNQSSFFTLMRISLHGQLMSGWNSTSFCNFAGITCDHWGDAVAIDISDWSLRGHFPSHVCLYLPNLRSLRLGYNDLRGDLFPVDVLSCLHLRELNLSSTGLIGAVPDLSGLASLKVIDMSSNFFTGEFPISVFKLTDVEVVNFNENPGFNMWQLPESIARMRKLTVLVLSTTSLRGELPEWIGNITSLVDLEMCGNYHVGRIPTSIGKLRNLRRLELYYNLFQGPIPDEIGNLTNLVDLDISVNQLTGVVPEGLCKLPKLRFLQFYNNSLTGEIPPVIVNSTTLVIFSIYQNFFTGQLHPNLGESSELVVLELSENLFYGELPRNACARGKLSYFLVLGNLFTGGLPENYGSCISLLRLRVDDNRLTGTIPPSLFALPHVSIIDLSMNNFHGIIPTTIRNAKNLSALFMQRNQISGSLPVEIALVKNLVKIDLSHNRLSGSIPEQFGELTKLNLLSLQNNNLSSSIPSSLSSLKSLNVLNLSNNLLTGEIPGALCDLLPNSVIFSNNHLSGPIPLSLLREDLTESFSGNPDLCIPNNISLSTPLFLALCPRPKVRKRLCTIWAVTVSSALSIVGALILLKRRFNVSKCGVVVEEDGIRTSLSSSYDVTTFHMVCFDRGEILKSLTDKNIVGRGGSGTVFRVPLGNGDLVAVKKLGTKKASVTPLWRLDRELRSEVDTLGSIRHKNIVKLYCCFSSTDSNLLVYEFMPNGNLWDALHRHRSCLNWAMRLKVALGVAQGLAYLHHDLLRPIVHRDIKSSNVLLDAEYEPKVADFGIAKVLQAKGREDSSSTTVIAGTCGYLAPGNDEKSTVDTNCRNINLNNLQLVNLDRIRLLFQGHNEVRRLQLRGGAAGTGYRKEAIDGGGIRRE